MGGYEEMVKTREWKEEKVVKKTTAKKTTTPKIKCPWCDEMRVKSHPTRCSSNPKNIVKDADNTLLESKIATLEFKINMLQNILHSKTGLLFGLGEIQDLEDAVTTHLSCYKNKNYPKSNRQRKRMNRLSEKINIFNEPARFFHSLLPIHTAIFPFNRQWTVVADSVQSPNDGIPIHVTASR